MLYVMDPIDSINIKKDTTYVIMLEAQSRDHDVYYCELKDLFIKEARGWCNAKEVKLKREDDYYKVNSEETLPLDNFDIIWMRKDPPST